VFLRHVFMSPAKLIRDYLNVLVFFVIFLILTIFVDWIFNIPSKWRIINCFSVVGLSLTVHYFLSQSDISLFYSNRRLINVFRNSRHWYPF
jgi:hypothetical protein